MRFIETQKLNDYISSVDNILAGDSLRSAYAKIEGVQTASLQGFSIDGDRDFLKEVSYVLNVIISIINHPHISNKREEVVIRIEQAQFIDEEAFRRILTDSSLWKQHGMKMVPEEVHHYQHVDELRIYENRFIGLLISIIDKELSRFSTFYLNKLPTLKMTDVTLDDPAVGEIISEIDRLRRKSQFLMNTHFFREVTKGKPISRRIQPTNILVKDRLYCYCYRFYRKFVRYEDISDAKHDLRMYYFIHLLQEIKKHGYYLTPPKGPEDENRLLFEGLDFFLEILPAENENLEMTVRWRKAKTVETARHLLVFSPNGGERLTPDEIENRYGDYKTIDFISLWELTASRGEMITESVPESALISHWLESKTRAAFADKSIYEKYCPVCRSRDTEGQDDMHVCHFCGTEYVFTEVGSRDMIWFRKIGVVE